MLHLIIQCKDNKANICELLHNLKIHVLWNTFGNLYLAIVWFSVSKQSLISYNFELLQCVFQTCILN